MFSAPDHARRIFKVSLALVIALLALTLFGTGLVWMLHIYLSVKSSTGEAGIEKALAGMFALFFGLLTLGAAIAAIMSREYSCSHCGNDLHRKDLICRACKAVIRA